MIPGRYRLVCGTFLLALLLYVDRVCISTAKGPLSVDLGLTDRQFGWALSAFALGYALCQTPAGMLADRFGPRRVLAAIVALWSFFTGLTGAVTGLRGLLFVRFLFGAGEAGAAVAWLTVAIFGADMTLSPSWAACVDIGRDNAGAVSGTMNMAGNLGSFVTSLAFPYLLAWTGNVNVFFFTGAALNLLVAAGGGTGLSVWAYRTRPGCCAVGTRGEPRYYKPGFTRAITAAVRRACRGGGGSRMGRVRPRRGRRRRS